MYLVIEEVVSSAVVGGSSPHEEFNEEVVWSGSFSLF